MRSCVISRRSSNWCPKSRKLSWVHLRSSFHNLLQAPGGSFGFAFGMRGPHLHESYKLELTPLEQSSYKVRRETLFSFSLFFYWTRCISGCRVGGDEVRSEYTSKWRRQPWKISSPKQRLCDRALEPCLFHSKIQIKSSSNFIN